MGIKWDKIISCLISYRGCWDSTATRNEPVFRKSPTDSDELSIIQV